MENQVNVVFMGNFVYPHGMADAKRIQHFLDYLREQAVPSRVLLLRQGGVPVTCDTACGVHKGIPYKTIGFDIRLDLFLLFTLVKYVVCGVATLFSWRRRGAKNVLYCYSGLSLENVVFVAVARLAGYRVVLDIVEDNTFIKEKLHPLAKLKWLSGEFLERHITSFADGLVVISSYLQGLYLKEVGAALPMALIPITARCQPPPDRSENRERVTFVYSGSFAKKDGLEFLIEAFQRTRKAHENCVLLLTGRGANLPAYQALIAGKPGIEYVGYLEDEEFQRFLRHSDVLCITRTSSTYANAGFPFKLGEYLATGNPVVVSEVGDVSHYLRNMQDAIIVKPDDVDAIEKALTFCLENPEAAAKIGLSGQKRCGEFFDPAVNGKKLLELLDRI